MLPDIVEVRRDPIYEAVAGCPIALFVVLAVLNSVE
jgi:hypothetical protein